MTITNTTRSITATGNGSTTTWPYTFNIPDAASAQVKLVDIATGNETILTSGQYTISNLGSASGGNVEYPLSGDPLTSATKIVIYRVVPRTQTTTISNQTRYNAGVVMSVWDRLVMMIQELTSDVSRTLRAPVGENALDEIPAKTVRASKFAAYDADGQPVAAVTVDTAVVTSFMETVLDDEDQSTALTTLGAATAAQGAAADSAMQDLVDDVTPQLGGPLDANSKIVKLAKGADVASATALTLGADGNFFDVTGTTTITSITTVAVGTRVTLQFDGALTLTHHATDLILPRGMNITTAAGDVAEFVEYATGDWVCTSYTKTDGKALFETCLQMVSATDGAVATGTTQMPLDDTIPQNTEGTQFMSLAITPKSASSYLVIDVTFVAGLSGATVSHMMAALFRDSTANALAAAVASFHGSSAIKTLTFQHIVASGSTSATTFKVRAGPQGASDTVTFNGLSGTRYLGGIFASSIVIREYL